MWLSRLFNHFRSDRISDDIDREMSFHIDEKTDALIALGLSPRAARDEARRRFGNVGRQKENTRERDLFMSLDTLIGDLRYAFRSLRSAPAFAFVAILSLALGIGANTAIFSIVNAVMLKSLPVSHPEELVSVAIDGSARSAFTNPLWEAIRDRQNMFDGVAAFGPTDFNLAAGGEARRVGANWVSGSYFRMLGVGAATGRLVSAGDDVRGCAGTAVLGYNFWQNEYAGRADVVGKTIALDGHPFTILGVADPRFTGLEVGAKPQVFVPLCSEAIIRGANSQLDRRSSWFLHVLGRPKPGLTAEQMNAHFAGLASGIIEATLPPNWSAEATKGYREQKFTVTPASKGFSDLRMMYSKALYVLMTIVGLVLLIACANVANLMLARATVRQHEMAVRLALGAGRGRLARQLITESLLLSTIGAALGVVLASWGSRVLVGLLSRSDKVVSLDLSTDPRMLLFTIAIAVGTALLFGLVPAWRAGRVDPQTAMKAQGRGVAEGHSRFNLGKTLVVAQVALSLVLVVGAGLLVSSWRRLATVDPGFRRDQVLLIDADIRNTLTEPDDRLALHERMLQRLRAVPGVQMAAASQLTPLSTSSWNDFIRVDGYAPAKSKKETLPWANAVSDGFFTALDIPFLAGRDFDSRDTRTSPPVIIVNEAFVKRYFHGESPIGRFIQRQEGKDWGPHIQVIGIVGTTKYRSLRDSAQAIMYFPRTQESTTAQYVSFELRTNGSPLSIAPAVKSALADVDPRITLDITTLDRQLDQSLVLMRTIATLSGFFGVLALLLATIGLYGIMAYTVARRRNEIGVRIALGAAISRVVRMVLGETGRIVIAGVVLGVALSFAGTRLVRSFLYGLEPTDSTTLVTSALVLVAVGLAAAAVPALRAARTDPVNALREE